MNDLYVVGVVKEDGSVTRASRPCSKEEAEETMKKMQDLGCGLPLKVVSVYTIYSM